MVQHAFLRTFAQMRQRMAPHAHMRACMADKVPCARTAAQACPQSPQPCSHASLMESAGSCPGPSDHPCAASPYLAACTVSGCHLAAPLSALTCPQLAGSLQAGSTAQQGGSTAVRPSSTARGVPEGGAPHVPVQAAAAAAAAGKQASSQQGGPQEFGSERHQMLEPGLGLGTGQDDYRQPGGCTARTRAGPSRSAQASSSAASNMPWSPDQALAVARHGEVVDILTTTLANCLTDAAVAPALVADILEVVKHVAGVVARAAGVAAPCAVPSVPCIQLKRSVSCRAWDRPAPERSLLNSRKHASHGHQRPHVGGDHACGAHVIGSPHGGHSRHSRDASLPAAASGGTRLPRSISALQMQQLEGGEGRERDAPKTKGQGDAVDGVDAGPGQWLQPSQTGACPMSMAHMQRSTTAAPACAQLRREGSAISFSQGRTPPAVLPPTCRTSQAAGSCDGGAGGTPAVQSDPAPTAHAEPVLPAVTAVTAVTPQNPAHTVTAPCDPTGLGAAPASVAAAPETATTSTTPDAPTAPTTPTAATAGPQLASNLHTVERSSGKSMEEVMREVAARTAAAQAAATAARRATTAMHYNDYTDGMSHGHGHGMGAEQGGGGCPFMHGHGPRAHGCVEQGRHAHSSMPSTSEGLGGRLGPGRTISEASGLSGAMQEVDRSP